MLKRTILIGLAALAAVAYAQPPGPGFGRGRGGPGGPGMRILGAEPGMPGRVVKNAPFSADVVTESAQTLPDGNHIKQSVTVHTYRDSEGRTRREQPVPNLPGAGTSSQGQLVFIDDPVAGASYALEPADHTATKMTRWAGRRGGPPPDRAGAPGPGARMRAQNANVKTESLGTQTIEGVQAQGTRTTLTIPAGQIGNEQPIQVVTESWYSPELQTVVLRKRSDPRMGDSVTRMININRSEPPKTMFEVPVDYKVTDRVGGPMRRGPRQQQ